MATINELLAQKAELERQISRLQSQERQDAIKQIKALMTEHGLKASDLGVKVARNSAQPKIAPKYRDPLSGAEWTGRGLKPQWVRDALASGRKMEDLAIV